MSERIYLEYVGGNSSKFWEATVDGKTFTVNFGGIGSTGQQRTKVLASPEAAMRAYRTKVNEKLNKGYEPINGVHTVNCTCMGCKAKAPVGPPTLSRPSKVAALLADEDDPAPPAPAVPAAPAPPKLKPMLADEVDHLSLVNYVEDEDWVMEQKVDGHRVLVTVVNGRATATGRNGQSSQHAVRFMQPHYADIRKLDTVVLDGELVGDVFWLFDMPWNGGEIDPKSPYEERRAALDTLMAVWQPDPKAYRLLPAARTKEEKAKLAMECLQKGGEGVMLKRRNGVYVPGGRVRHVLKAKFIKDADFVITGVGLNGHDNYGLGLYRDGTLVDVGRCSAIGKEQCQVGDVATVRYLYIGADQRLYQPRFMCKRTDKDPEECLYDQIARHAVNKAVFA